MATNSDNLTLDQSFFDQNSDYSSSPIRTFQTNLTDPQFVEKGLLIFDPAKSGKTTGQFIGSTQSWDSPHPILIQANVDYPDLLTDQRTKSAPKQLAWLPEFEARLRALDEAAVEDEIEISPESQSDAKAFVKGLSGVRQPSVFLSRNGNTRLRWANARGEKVGLQFRGDAEVQYIFFKQVSDKTEQMLGIKLISSIESFISACGMRHVISQ